MEVRLAELVVTVEMDKVITNLILLDLVVQLVQLEDQVLLDLVEELTLVLEELEVPEVKAELEELAEPEEHLVTLEELVYLDQLEIPEQLETQVLTETTLTDLVVHQVLVEALAQEDQPEVQLDITFTTDHQLHSITLAQ